MKSFFYPWLALLALLACFTTCNKEITNPFDPDCPKEIWTPADFQAVQSENTINLTWKLNNRNISGFKIDRKVGSQNWSNIASPGKTAASWTDTDLTGGEIHQYRLYAQAGNNQSNTITTQITPVSTANITTLTETNLTCHSAALGGAITHSGGAAITERGIVYAVTAHPTITDTKVPMGKGEGSFSQTVTGLAEVTTYYVKAYATNSEGTSYGNQIYFKTPACVSIASVTTSTPTNIGCSSTTLGGSVTSDGGATVTERGVVYATAPNPSIANSKVIVGSGMGSFTKTITGLPLNTTFYVNAYAKNSAGVGYGDEKSFKTPTTASITTTAVTGISTTSAILGGSVTDDGGTSVTERGSVYATTSNPTLSNNKVAIGNGTGSFSQTVSGLACGTTYYARAYAVNCAGTVYGNQITFPTSDCSNLNFYFASIKATSTVLPSGTIFINGTLTGTGLIIRTYSPTIAIYVSSNGLIDIKDRPVYEVQASLSSLQSSFSFSHQITAPSFPTSFYLVFLADSKMEYNESNESDNRAMRGVTVVK